MCSFGELLQGIVIETRTQSWTGPYLYSDQIHSGYQLDEPLQVDQPFLNEWARIKVLGIAAGLTRMALAVIHSIGHLFAALLKFDKGHCIHAAKGACEFLRGFLETIPILGRRFAENYYKDGQWWIIKIYNPDAPDTLDHFAENWASLKQKRPSAYFPCKI